MRLSQMLVLYADSVPLGQSALVLLQARHGCADALYGVARRRRATFSREAIIQIVEYCFATADGSIFEHFTSLHDLKDDGSLVALSEPVKFSGACRNCGHVDP